MITKEEQQEVAETYEKLKAFLKDKPGPALHLACLWHNQEVKLMKNQIENLQKELITKCV